MSSGIKTNAHTFRGSQYEFSNSNSQIDDEYSSRNGHTHSTKNNYPCREFTQANPILSDSSNKENVLYNNNYAPSFTETDETFSYRHHQ